MDFDLSEEEIDDTTRVIAVTGEADLHTAPALKARMADAIDSGKRQVVVDLSGATLVDSTTLGVLVGGERQLSEEGGRVIVVCPDEAIRKTFEVTGLDGTFPVHRSRDEALAVASGADLE